MSSEGLRRTWPSHLHLFWINKVSMSKPTREKSGGILSLPYVPWTILDWINGNVNSLSLNINVVSYTCIIRNQIKPTFTWKVHNAKIESISCRKVSLLTALAVNVYVQVNVWSDCIIRNQIKPTFTSPAVVFS
jgi:hypothetical protein